MILPIVLEGDPVLRQVAKPQRKFNRSLLKLMADMLETMYDAPGVGLAAPQIGLARRIVVIDAGEGDGPLYLVNPEIRERTGAVRAYEGCLSVPGYVGEVERYQRVLVHAFDADGRELWLRGEDWLARIFQHEIDHLDGVLYKDRAFRVVPDEVYEAEIRAEQEEARRRRGSEEVENSDTEDGKRREAEGTGGAAVHSSEASAPAKSGPPRSGTGEGE